MSEVYALEGWGTDEDDEYVSYEEAVARFRSLLADAENGGWCVERGWASRDNLSAARLTHDDASEQYLEIVVIEHDDDDEL